MTLQVQLYHNIDTIGTDNWSKLWEHFHTSRNC